MVFEKVRDISIVVIMGILIHALYYVRDKFRANIKKGDTVGVKFGDYVVNRVVDMVNDKEVIVKDYVGSHLVCVPKERVYLKDDKGEEHV